MSLEAKTTIFKKDKNNNLSAKECDTFVKNYKDFTKGVISKITNPKTNKPLNDNDRIKYIYDKCKQKLGIRDSKSPKSKSKSKSSDSGDNEIILDSYEKVKDIIYIPFNTLQKNKQLIASLFTKPISYDIGLVKLSEYLYNTTNSHNIYVKSYKKILVEINDIINSIYNNHNQNTQNILKQQHGWVENYIYDPLRRSDIASRPPTAPDTQSAIKKTKRILAKMWEETYYIGINDIRGRGLNTMVLDEMRNILFYSSTNKNKREVIKNLNDNIEKYIALQFIIVIMRDEVEDSRVYNYDNIRTMENHLDLFDSLITKTIVNVLFDDNSNYNSQSISKSISWSGTPRSSSSGHSHFQSKANIARYRKTKADLVAEITENNINEMDPYLAERWEDMPLKKLRNVISIKHNEGSNTYRVAFYIRTLYQAWNKAVKDSKPFKNPYTRKNFTEDDKVYILRSIKKLYPNIEKPKIANGRSDIIVETRNNFYNDESVSYTFSYKLNFEKRPILIHLLTFSIPLNFNTDVEPAYIQPYIFENITYLIKNNILFGKSMPLKIIPGFKEYIGKNIIFFKDNYDEYKVFFDKIKNAL
jgi:hypothetical protein